jgi:tetratricopeptide (TPR) repeat protein
MALALTCLVVATIGLPGCGWFRKPSPMVDAAPQTPTPPPDAGIALENAEAFAEMGDRARALAEFRRAIEINPELTEAYLGAGELYMDEGDYGSAEPLFAQAAQIEPQSFDAQYNHGLALHLLDRLVEAIGAYARALRINPNSFEANLHLSTAYAQLGEFDQALPYAERTVELDPRSADARRNLATIYRSLDEHEAAVAELQQAAELMELTPELLFELSDSLGKLSRYPEMIVTLEQLIDRAPSPGAYERLGFAQFRLERYEEAEQSFDEALQLDPDYYPALNGVGVCLLNKYISSGRTDNKSLDRAVSMLRRSLRVKRDQPRVVQLLGRYG